jgi:acyl-coenzyme A synthetase/AMP-(fatty) acid ligase
VTSNIVVCHAPRVKTHDTEEGNEGFNQLVKDLWVEGRDFWWHELMAKAADTCKQTFFLFFFVISDEPLKTGDVEWMNAEDPLFMLYTSGSTGTPKGVQVNIFRNCKDIADQLYFIIILAHYCRLHALCCNNIQVHFRFS